MRAGNWLLGIGEPWKAGGGAGKDKGRKGRGSDRSWWTGEGGLPSFLVISDPDDSDVPNLENGAGH